MGLVFGFLAPSRREQNVQQLFFSHFLGLQLDGFLLFGADHVDRQFRQVPHHRFHVASHVAHFREFAGFDFEKRRLRQPRQSACDLGFAHAGGADHDDILGGDLIAEMIRDLLAAPAVAQGDGHHAFGFLLTDDVFVQLAHDFRWSKRLLHGLKAPRW